MYEGHGGFVEMCHCRPRFAATCLLASEGTYDASISWIGSSCHALVVYSNRIQFTRVDNSPGSASCCQAEQAVGRRVRHWLKIKKSRWLATAISRCRSAMRI